MACRKARDAMLTQGYRGRRYRIYFSCDVILLIRKFGATWNVVSVMVFSIIVRAKFAMAINYLYWRPRYMMS